MKKTSTLLSAFSILVFGSALIFPQFFLTLKAEAAPKPYNSYNEAVRGNIGGDGHSSSVFGGQCPRPPNTFQDFVCISFDLVSLAIPYVAAGAVLAFIWGLSKIIYSSGNEEKIAEGKMIIKWGVTGLFFLFSIWGALWVFSAAFGFEFGIPLLPV